MAGRFAEGTQVEPEQSQADIAKLVRRYGATGYMQGWEGDRAAVAFQSHGRRVRFELVLPSVEDPQFARDGRGTVRTTAKRQAARDQEVRRLWRALALAIKAKFEVVESGIMEFEREFLANIVLADNRTVGEHVAPAIESSYASGTVPPSLLALPPGQG
jgi:hypothetical protein